jgi:DNA polymerase III delta prime subunit
MQITDPTLKRHIKNGKVAPSYLLVDRDILKLRAIAKWFAGEYLKITRPKTSAPRPAQGEELFTQFPTHADIFTLTNKEGANTIQVQETESFIEKVTYAAVGGRKLFIICDAATMTAAAQNKILKTIEDAGADTCFLLLCSGAETVLNTIKSRCVTVYPNPISLDSYDLRIANRELMKKLNLKFTSLTDLAMFENNKNAEQIFQSAGKLLFECATLDDALPLVPVLTQKENFPLAMFALNNYLSADY